MGQYKQTIGQLLLEEEPQKVIVTLQANQFHLDRLDQYKQFLKGQKDLLAGEIQVCKEEKLVIVYHKSETMNSLEKIIKTLPVYSRLVLAQKLYKITEYVGTPIQIFLHPSNLFVQGDEYWIAHRGFMQEVMPYTLDDQSLLKQYKALVLYILFPKLDYKILIEGAGALKDDLAIAIDSKQTINDIHQLISQQVEKEKQRLNKETKLVNKKRFLLYKWGSLGLLLTTVLLLVVSGLYIFKLLPENQQISEAKTAYINKDYGQVLTSLNQMPAEKLPVDAKYILSVSSVQLEDLSNDQKKAILNNLSLKSNDAALLYWIYIGKGEFKTALDLAKNLGDIQYIIHAYTKLYDATKTNMHMNGEKKQKQLANYEDQIKKYMKELTGDKDDEKEK